MSAEPQRAAAPEEPADTKKPKSPGFRLPRWIDSALLIVGLALLVYVVSRFPFADIVAAVRRMWPGVMLTPLIALTWFTSSTTAMYLLIDRRVPWARILWIRLVGDSYNALLPLAGFGGEPFKMRQLSFFVEPAGVMTTLIRDRLVDNAIGFLFGATELVLGLMVYTVHPSIKIALVGYILFCAVIGATGITLVLTRVPGKLGGWIARLLADVSQDQIAPLPVARLLQVVACCISARMLGLLEKVVLLWVLGQRHDVVTAAFVDSFLSAAGYVGFMIPQGLGVFEGATVYILGVVGAPGPAAVAFAFGRRGRMLVVGLFGISLHLAVLARDAIIPLFGAGARGRDG
jgi:hypothetical protein